MIYIFTNNHSHSCKKAIKWLAENKLAYKEKKIDNFISKEDLIRILLLTENGTDSIISQNSNEFKNLKVNLDALSFNEFLDYVSVRPGLLRHPLIIDDEKLQVGFNIEEIRRFMPREQRMLYKRKFRVCSDNTCLDSILSI